MAVHIHASKNRDQPRGSVRVLLAVGLWYTGCPQADIARFLGVSRQRVEQMLDRAGVVREGVSDAEIVRRIREAQAAGLVRRADIIRAVKVRSGLGREHISALITQATGAAPGSVYIPPPDTPPDWRWCTQCEAFAEPSSYYGYCRAHYNAYMRQKSMAARRAAGVPTPAEAAKARAARTRERLASVAHLSHTEAARALGMAYGTLTSHRWRYGRDGTKETT
jgi:hypothetical protein